MFLSPRCEYRLAGARGTFAPHKVPNAKDLCHYCLGLPPWYDRLGIFLRSGAELEDSNDWHGASRASTIARGDLEKPERLLTHERPSVVAVAAQRLFSSCGNRQLSAQQGMPECGEVLEERCSC